MESNADPGCLQRMSKSLRALRALTFCGGENEMDHGCCWGGEEGSWLEAGHLDKKPWTSEALVCVSDLSMLASLHPLLPGNPFIRFIIIQQSRHAFRFWPHLAPRLSHQRYDAHLSICSLPPGGDDPYGMYRPLVCAPMLIRSPGVK